MTPPFILQVLLLGSLLSTFPVVISAQTLVEQLRYPPDTKLVIFHAVDLRAQIERALAMGVRPTHLDSHQYRLIMNGKELFDVMLRVAHEYKLPVFVTRDWFADHPYLQASLDPGDIVLDHTVTIEPDIPPERWAEFYLTALKNLKPGVTEFVIHPGYDDDELRAATRERSTWDSAWRQRDYDFFTSDQFREMLAQQEIKLINWRELARAAEAK